MSHTDKRIELSGNGLTHCGLVRKANEDRFLVDDEHSVYAVADGIGGLPMGEKASECAIRVLKRITSEDSSDNLASPAEIIGALHQAVRQISSLISPEMGMGTTCTFIRALDGFCEIGHVGDSAAFLITDEATVKLTRDHVENAPGVDVISSDDDTSIKSRYLGRMQLSRYIGQPDPLEPGVFHFEPKAGQRILICSDGISSVIDTEEIHSVSQAQRESEALAQALIHIANSRGGFDNATAVVIECRGAG